MKVLLINGSPRNVGVTAKTLHAIEKELLEHGVDTEFVELGKIKMEHCIGCCSCYATGHCHIDDDAEELSEKIAKADGLVLGSPTYASNVSGVMKDFIDRGHFVIEQLLHGKYCITVATGENYGNRDTMKVLNDLVLYSGGRLSDSLLVKAPFNDASGVEELINTKAKKAAGKLFYGIEKKSFQPIQTLFHYVIFNFGIRSFVQKKGKKYQGVTNKWKANGIY